MTTTARLYYTDCYQREFEGRVVRTELEPRGVRVYLDRSAFYPESGGQLRDGGSLGGLPLLDVVDEGDAIAHVLERKPEGEVLKGVIDWSRRLDHMQQHTGQHILSAAFEKTGDYKTVSFHMSEQVSTIDLNSDRLGQRQIEEAEELANRVIFEDRTVRFSFRPAAEASRLDLRKPTQREGDVRLVEVEGFDLSACGGTHVSRTGTIGLVVTRGFERMKGGTRVEFVCGSRALKAARGDFLALTELGRLLSTSHERVPASVKKQAEELRAVFRAQEKQAKRLAEYRASELLQAAPEKNGRKIARHVFDAEEHLEAKMVAHAMAKRPSSVGLIGVKGEPATLYFAQSPGGPSDMVNVLRQIAAQVGGKGGGTRDFAQGGGLKEGRLEEALALAEGLV